MNLIKKVLKVLLGSGFILSGESKFFNKIIDIWFRDIGRATMVSALLIVGNHTNLVLLELVFAISLIFIYINSYSDTSVLSKLVISDIKYFNKTHGKKFFIDDYKYGNSLGLFFVGIIFIMKVVLSVIIYIALLGLYNNIV